MQQLAARNPYYNILAPKVAGNLSTETYDSLFQTFKVIYPDYARSHFVSDLKSVVTDYAFTEMVDTPTSDGLLHDDRHGSRSSDA